ncbi:LysR family transcriptional regulator [Pseudomonas silvicola]|nr:LysR family transcriptional regulator [Pseudomonas silvicola]
MDLRDLYYFETVADLGNLGRAGEKLHRTQPALSKCIQRLEDTLGTLLFFREGRRMRLTPAGELLLVRARRLRQGMEETERELQTFAKGTVGNVRVGCGPTAAEFLLPRVVALLLEAAPQLTLELVTGQNDMLMNDLRAGHLDVLISPLSGTSNLMVFLSVKPGSLDKVRDTITRVTSNFRGAPGNVAFDVFQDQDHPRQLVQLERWGNEALHQDNLKRPVIQTIRTGYEGTLDKPMRSGRVLIKDITEGCPPARSSGPGRVTNAAPHQVHRMCRRRGRVRFYGSSHVSSRTPCPAGGQKPGNKKPAEAGFSFGPFNSLSKRIHSGLSSVTPDKSFASADGVRLSLRTGFP